jgi:hypothetical protein
MGADEHRYADGRARHPVRAVDGRSPLTAHEVRVVGGAHGVTRPAARSGRF